jgi:beta-glucosidase
MNISKEQFGESFKWGISTAAAQTEGAFDEDGKSLSIWDVFSSKKGKIYKNQHPQIACDFYHRYDEDIALIKELNIPNFRFSISWSRILPEGTGAVNKAGIDFYNRVIDKCLELAIEPWVTLYHWDLPQALEEKGGWRNREIVEWFGNYAEVCARHFGDRVKHWIVMNEPAAFTGAGYFLGIHAPGKRGIGNYIPTVHHAVLCMAEGGRRLRALVPDAEIGTTFSCSSVEPIDTKPRNVDAAKRLDVLLNRIFIEPLLGMGYPTEDYRALRRIEKYILSGDEQKMVFDFDFIGLQNYTREIVKYSFFMPYLKALPVKAEKRKVPITDMKWEVYPEGMYEVIKRFSVYPQIRKIYITENGAAFPDAVTDGAVHDPLRVNFLQRYLEQVLKARQEGCRVEGYFVWTLTDNFEWAEGYRPRFGLVYVDFESQQRIVKSSGKWYGEFLKAK